MKRKWLGASAALLMSTALLVSGCGKASDAGGASSDASGNKKQIELKMLSSWSTDTQRGKAMKTVVDKFNEQYAGRIHVTVDINPDAPALQEKVKTMIAANQTPDLFNYNFNPNDLSRQKSGKLLDLTPYMDDAWKARFNQKDLDAMTVDGQLTAIPFEKAGVLFYYNTELFAKAGISEFPKTWDEFFAACDKLKAAGVTPISFMTADEAWHTTNALTYLVASLGGTSILDPGKSLDTPEMAKAAEYLRKMFNYTTPDALGGNYSVSSNNFLTGNTAMVIDGPWLIGSIPPEMLPKIAVATSPTFGDGKVKPGFTITDAYTPWSAAKQDSKEKEDAEAEFLKFMTTEESSKTYTLDGQIMLLTKLQLTDDELKKAGPVLGQFIKTNSQTPESLPSMVRTLKPSTISQIPSLIERLALDNLTPEQFAKELQAANQ